MKAMSSYISAGSNAHMLSRVCVDEIEDHFQHPSGSFSSDNKIYSYALCTSVFLRGVVDGVIQPHQSGVDCFFFTI